MARYFEDLRINEVFETSGYTMTKSEIMTFAENYDPQPFHIDEEAARESMFGGIVASGLHTLAISVRLFVNQIVRSQNIAIMGGRGMDDLRWTRPVYPGDKIRVKVTVTKKSYPDTKRDRGYVDFMRRVLNSNDKLVMSSKTHSILERKKSK